MDQLTKYSALWSIQEQPSWWELRDAKGALMVKATHLYELVISFPKVPVTLMCGVTL